MRAVIPFLTSIILLTTGCVVSETEKGPGPGDRKKESATDHAPAADPAPPVAPATTTPSP